MGTFAWLPRDALQENQTFETQAAVAGNRARIAGQVTSSSKPSQKPWPSIPGLPPSGCTLPIQFYLLPPPCRQHRSYPLWIGLTSQYPGGVLVSAQKPSPGAVLDEGRERISRGWRSWGKATETGGKEPQVSGDRPGQGYTRTPTLYPPCFISTVPSTHTCTLAGMVTST